MSNLALTPQEQELINEITNKNDISLLNTITCLNESHNYRKFTKQKINMDKILMLACKEALDRNLSINTKGYIDLIPIIKQIQK